MTKAKDIKSYSGAGYSSIAKKNVAKNPKKPFQKDVSKPNEKKEEALKEALSSAFSHTSTLPNRNVLDCSVDTYGKGSPTDRLQFGYSPSVADEAIAYHSLSNASQWIAQRKKLGRIAIVKKQKLQKSNFEGLASLLKLKSHWKEVSEFSQEIRAGTSVDLKEAEELLEMLASKQRTE